MNREEIKQLAIKDLWMYDLTEILDDAVLDFFYANINKVENKSCDNCKFKYSEKCPVTGLNNMYTRFYCNIWRLK